MKFNTRITLGSILILFLAGWIFVNMYLDAKPKTSADLLGELILGKRESLVLDEDETIVNELNDFTDFFEGTTRVNQYMILENEGKYLLIETTPGLIEQQLKIKQIQELPEEVFDALNTN